MNCPGYRNQFKDIEAFKVWLGLKGGTVVNGTNQYEVLRVRVQNGKTLILYQNSKGQLTWPDVMRKAYESFKNGSDFNGLLKVTKRKPSKPIRERLLNQYGHNCWFCHKPMPEDDRTLEHLLAKADGGSNNEKNCVLAHDECNRKVDRLSIHEKVLIREKNLNLNIKEEI